MIPGIPTLLEPPFNFPPPPLIEPFSSHPPRHAHTVVSVNVYVKYKAFYKTLPLMIGSNYVCSYIKIG